MSYEFWIWLAASVYLFDGIETVPNDFMEWWNTDEMECEK